MSTFFRKVATFAGVRYPAGYSGGDGGPAVLAQLNLPRRLACASNGNVYVTFVKFGGGGYVDVFNESGTLLQQLIANGNLNEPWGLTIAPSTFGTFANSLLVGNLGDGKINAYDPGTGSLIGTLTNKRGKALKISGLWSLDPVPTGEVTFSAGPNGYANGLIGLIKPL